MITQNSKGKSQKYDNPAPIDNNIKDTTIHTDFDITLSNNRCGASSKFKSDIKVRCYRFGLTIISLIDKLPNKRSVFIISDQLVRSATSIGANLVEARASSSRLEFKKFYEIALKSANETKYWLCLLRDGKFANPETVNTLLNESIEIANMLASSVIKLKSKKF